MKRKLIAVRRSERDRKGYVLVMTIMILAIAALIVTGIVRHSLHHATSAKRELAKLEQRWAIASCQRFCLQNADRILKETGGSSFDLNVQLAGYSIKNRIEDESAKLDINALAELVSETELKSVISDLASTPMLRVQLRPVQTTSTVNRPFQSWGQIFESRPEASLEDIRAASENLSCWGGKLNVRTADDDVLRRAIKSVAGGIVASRILKARNDNPKASLGQLLVDVDANDRQGARLRSLLTSRSWSTSVWTDLVSENRIDSYFAVQERPVTNIRRYQTIRW